MGDALVSTIRGIVVAVRDLDEADKFYRAGLGLDGRMTDLPGDCAAAWGLGDAPVRAARFEKSGCAFGGIECIEWNGCSGTPIRDPERPYDFGILSLNVKTGDLDRGLALFQAHGATAVSDPQAYFAGKPVREVMATTPTGERYTILQVGEAVPTDPIFGEAVATVGIVVPDLDAASEFYCGLLGLSVALDLDASGPPFSTLLGLSHESRLRAKILTADGEWTAKTELLEMIRPDSNEPARDLGDRTDGRFAGYWMTSVFSHRFDELLDRLITADTPFIVEPRVLARPFVGTTRAAIVRAPGGDWLEIIEKPA